MTLSAKFLSGAALAAMLVSVPAAADAGDWMMRLRGIYVKPDDSATISTIGGTSDVGSEFTGEVDFTYFITDKFAAELILATTKHSVAAVDTALGDVDLGSVWLLPPTLTFQYHPLAGEKVSPYIGAGVNYTFFYNEDAPGGTVTAIDYKNKFGLAAQAGVDIAMGEKWFINFDVKKIWLNTDVSLNGGAITADVDIDPWIFGAGFGFRF
ncbi:OmpW/AlkL family protein [Pseudokordiimonas caeni]|uniref:OmpW/AlkL family protein n=1 Tax=Pseudokordiimonas caeni TaxID=2997908 RepID=UPI0028128E8C|nr:OmpW family outer membrane protein [Pseudokordiimonas caeni]